MQVFPFRINADTLCQTYSNAYGKFAHKVEVGPTGSSVCSPHNFIHTAAIQFHHRHCSNNRSVLSFSGQMIAALFNTLKIPRAHTQPAFVVKNSCKTVKIINLWWWQFSTKYTQQQTRLDKDGFGKFGELSQPVLGWLLKLIHITFILLIIFTILPDRNTIEEESFSFPKKKPVKM